MTLMNNVSERSADLSRRNFLRASAIAGQVCCVIGAVYGPRDRPREVIG